MVAVFAPWRALPDFAALHPGYKSAGFVNRGGKGSHKNFVHPKVARPITLAGKESDDAKAYQEKAVQSAIEESRK